MEYFRSYSIRINKPIYDTVITTAASSWTSRNLLDSESCKQFDLINHHASAN